MMFAFFYISKSHLRVNMQSYALFEGLGLIFLELFTYL